MPLTRAFISFDYDHDLHLYHAIRGQALLPDSPFAIADHSLKTASSDWMVKARHAIRRSQVVIVMCGRHTSTAAGVASELGVAQNEGVDYFLLVGYRTGTCLPPRTAQAADRMYDWTWPNLKLLVGGIR